MPNPVRLVYDGLANMLTGKGGSMDRRSHNYYTPRTVSQQQVMASYRDSWLMRKLVDLPASDMVREGRDWKGDKAIIAKIETETKRLAIIEKLRLALSYGRLGGGAIIIGLSDNTPDKPLPATIRPGALTYLHVVTRHALSIGPINRDLTSPFYGEPEYFQLSGAGTTARIHPSRVITFKGLSVPRDIGVSDYDAYWGDPLYRSVIDAVQNADTALDGFAGLIDEAKVDVWKLKGLAELAGRGTEGETAFLKRVEITNAAKSIHRAVILDSEDEWSQRQIAWTGMPDLARLFLSVVAGASDIPVTRLLGKSAEGMNATGDGDERNYVTMLSTQQEAYLRPAWERLDAVALPSAGIMLGSDDWWEFAPLTKMTEAQRSEIDKRKADTAKVYADSGLVPVEALSKGVQNMLIEDGTFAGLEQALAETPDDMTGEPDDLELQAEQIGGDLSSRGAGASETMPRRRAANDAEPRTLYVQRKLLNAAELIAWAKSQGFETTLPADDMHVTIAYSKARLDWLKVESDWSNSDDGKLTVQPGGARIVEPLGDKGAVVLLFNASHLSWRHESIIRAGASHDYPEYQPHVTITYSGGGVDLANVEPYRGKLVFGPEIFEELDEDWAGKLTEA